MISNDTLQAGLVAYLQAIATITAVVSSAEIREDQYQGTQFSYPNIRVRLIDNVPDALGNNCNITRLVTSIEVRSEKASSMEADNISGIIASELHKKTFTANGVRFWGIRVTSLSPAFREDERTFRSEVLFTANADG